MVVTETAGVVITVTTITTVVVEAEEEAEAVEVAAAIGERTSGKMEVAEMEATTAMATIISPNPLDAQAEVAEMEAMAAATCTTKCKV